MIYDLNDYIADVGGYLGLLIGQSMFTMYVMAEEWMKRRMRRKKGKKMAHKSVICNKK